MTTANKTMQEVQSTPMGKGRRIIRTISRILIGLMVAVAIFAIVVAMQPAEYSVTRSAKMSAPPSQVFAQVNNFHNWDAWSPWAKLDPAAKTSFAGPPAGTGAGFTWAGNDKIGEGRMTIVESRPNDLIRLKLEFLRPFASTCTTDFTFKPVGDQTAVTWTMSGRKNFVSKAFCMFASMDKMVGGDFEKGLAQLKAVVESPAGKSGV